MPNLAELIEPMPGKIAVQVDTKDEITPAGLYIPEGTARSIHEARPTQGVIVAIGEHPNEEDALMEPVLPVSVGDRIIFGKYAGVELKYRPPDVDGKRQESERIILLEFKSILAKIKDPEDADKITVKG
jgi:chaperonin GroES